MSDRASASRDAARHERPIRVALAGGSELTRTGVAVLCYRHREVLTLLDEHDSIDAGADVVLVDPDTPPGHAVPSPAEARERYRAERVAYFPSGSDGSLPGDARAYGYDQVISKAATEHHLVSALIGIHDHALPPRNPTPPLSPERQARALTGRPLRPHDPDHDVIARTGLTPREVDVLVAIMSGWSNTMIATQHYLSVNTVKAYIRSAYRRIHVTTRSQAVRWAIDNLPQHPRLPCPTTQTAHP